MRKEREELLTVDEVAERLSVHSQTVRRWLRAGQINGTMISRRAGYRIRASEVERIADEGLLSVANSPPMEAEKASHP